MLLSVPFAVDQQVQMHEPILTISDASKLKSEFEFTYAELSKVGVPINLVRLSHLPLPPAHMVTARLSQPTPHPCALVKAAHMFLIKPHGSCEAFLHWELHTDP